MVSDAIAFQTTIHRMRGRPCGWVTNRGCDFLDASEHIVTHFSAMRIEIRM